MTYFLTSLPTILAGIVVVVISLRAVYQARRNAAVVKLEIAQWVAGHERSLAAVRAEYPDTTRPMVLQLTLDLSDANSVADVLRVAHGAERMIAGLSKYETSIGGRGLILTQAKAAPGQVILTLTPKDATGAGSRVERVAEALNAAFNPATPTPEIIPNLGNLPGDVSGAHAVALAA